MNKFKKIILGICWLAILLLVWFFGVAPVKQKFFRPVKFSQKEKISVIEPTKIIIGTKKIKLAGITAPVKNSILYQQISK